jgi:MinD superfamily P-loop ATPase
VCINKFDINEQNAHEIERYCSIEHMAVAGKIPFDSVVSEAMVHGSLMVEYSDGQVSREIRKLWDAIRITLESDWRG